tara:strand:+ start:15539 stop:16369 length:831 start_codon:yes stop_codon:yes gene_type:complete
MDNKIVHRFIIGVFLSLYVLVATTSMINSVAFFDLSHNIFMSWTLAIGFELGAAASLAAILILDKTNKIMVWGLFVTLTLFQMMANTFHAYINLEAYTPWVELFGLIEEEPMMQKRILSIVSGAILPLVALGFIKSLTDYIKPEKEILKTEENGNKTIELLGGQTGLEELASDPVSQLTEIPEEVTPPVTPPEKKVSYLINGSGTTTATSITEVPYNTFGIDAITELETQPINELNQSKPKPNPVKKKVIVTNEVKTTEVQKATAPQPSKKVRYKP